MTNDQTQAIHDYILEHYKLNITNLFLLLAHVLPGLHFCFMHGVKLSKVTLVKILDQCPFFTSHFLIRHKTFNIELEDPSQYVFMHLVAQLKISCIFR